MATYTDIWSDFQNLYQQNQPPYRFNILSEQQGTIVENSHTNILMKILEYKKGDSFPFLHSFCKCMFNNWYWGANGEIKFEREFFCNGQNRNGRIDGLIYKQGCFAIIIENKINGATDQQNQLCLYINEVCSKPELNIQRNNIFVIYLTREGGEPKYLIDLAGSMECAVISDENKKPIGVDSLRYASINYGDDILGWLKEYVLPEVKYKDATLRSGLEQYIDYLESMFSTENLPQDLIDATYKLLEKYVTGMDYAAKVNCLHNLYKKVAKENKKTKKDKEYKERAIVKNALLAIIEKYKNEDTRQFVIITKEYFEKVLGASCHIHSYFTNYYINIYCQEKWGKDIFFAWCPNSLQKIKNGKELTFSVNFRTTELQTRADKWAQNLESSGGYAKAANAPSAWRRELNLNNEQWNMLKPCEEQLRNTYNRLVNKVIIEVLDNIYNNVMPYSTNP